MFSVPNAKYLAFGILDGDAFRALITWGSPNHLLKLNSHGLEFAITQKSLHLVPNWQK